MEMKNNYHLVGEKINYGFNIICGDPHNQLNPGLRNYIDLSLTVCLAVGPCKSSPLQMCKDKLDLTPHKISYPYFC